MPFTCLTCRKVVEHLSKPRQRACADCGGELAGEEGAWLNWNGPGGEGMMWLSKNQVLFGRRSECDVVLEDGRVSAQHAFFHREGSHWYVRDGCSKDGTFVNGHRIVEKKLEDRDQVTLGKTEIHFHAQGAPAGSGSVAIVPMLDSEEAVQTCLPCGPGDFMPEWEVEDEREIRSDYERLRVAYLFHQTMGSIRDEHELVESVLKFAFERLPADRGAVLLRKQEGNPLVPAVTHYRQGCHGSEATTETMIPDSILRRAVQERAAVLSGDATVDLRFQDSQSVIRENIRSAMCVPLIGQHEVFGAIYLDTQEATGAFQVKDLRILTTVASQAAPVIERYRLQQRLEKEAITQERLRRFLSPEVLQEVLERGLELEKGGQTGQVTVLFCDIRGFTSLAENMDPFPLVRMLNAYFERLVEVVFRHGGILDKFIGDALMGVWGAPIRKRDDALQAVAAGQKIISAVELFNRSSSGQGWPRLKVGVGLNTGQAVIGMVGSSRRMEYTVMGDAVNLAARVCNLAQGGQMLVTEDTLKAIERSGGKKPRVRDLPPAKVRGRQTPVQVFECIKS